MTTKLKCRRIGCDLVVIEGENSDGFHCVLHQDEKKEKEETPSPKSFAAEVIADNSGKWCGNGLYFATEDEAGKYVRDLEGRWVLVRDTRVIQVVGQEPNYRWVDGKGIERIETPVQPTEPDWDAIREAERDSKDEIDREEARSLEPVKTAAEWKAEYERE